MNYGHLFRGVALALAMAMTMSVSAQEFDRYFEANTLRVDYIFGGDSAHQYIQMEQLYKQPQWAGRRARLAETLLRGNGQIHMYDHETHKLIYVHTFSTLFQEWQNELEATQMNRSFEASYNLPFPKAKVDIEVTMTDNHNKVTSRMTHTVDPKDILIRHIGDNGIPYKYIVKSGDISDCVDIAIVAEAYTANEMDKFYKDAQRAADALFSHEPFASMKDKFNVVAVGSVSRESGPSMPGRGIWHDTACSSHYDTFYSDRYLTTSKVHTLFDILSGVPFEHIIVLVNSSRYGGGGIYNQWMCSTSDHYTFKQVLVHEFGHSYAGLADEYDYGDSHTEWYPADTEPWEPNITTLKDFDSKWKDMMEEEEEKSESAENSKKGHRHHSHHSHRKEKKEKKSKKDKKQKAVVFEDPTQKVGLFEGAGYQTKGTYRPAEQCRMKVNEVENFCPVCTRAIKRITEFYTAQ